MFIKGEDFVEHKYAEEFSARGSPTYTKKGMRPTDWEMVFIHLPKGINQVIFEGFIPEKSSVSGILMDDLVIAPCATFGKQKQLFFSYV